MHLSRSFASAATKYARCTARTRTLWTAATCSHPDLATALSRCLPESSTPSASPTKDSVTIVLASRSYPGSDLLTLPAKIPEHVSKSSFVLGAVVDRVPTKSGHGVSTLTLAPTLASESSADRLIQCHPFYLSGADSRRKRLKEKSVGKWARSQDIEERSLDTADAWSSFKSISIGQNQVQVPEVIVAQSEGASENQEQDVLMISDLEVHQFLEALDAASPAASKVGLMASSTPFITGRPVTMFYDGKLVQDGVLGVSLVKEARGHKRIEGEVKTLVEYPSMAPLGPAMQITRCRGNIILELDESNATRLLLDRLQATTLTKDKEYFLATGKPTAADQDEDSNVDMSNATVKGNMAVDTVHDLKVGQWVQFIHHDKVQEHGHFASPTREHKGTVRFSTSDPNNTIEEQPATPLSSDTDGTVQSTFGGSSENGFIVGQANEGTWVCTVADSVLWHKL
ncbi:hypothetical protein BGZ70_002303 [Mortierella alpina]|uniref:FIST domain-containing protein n=1 Tax=Mortierella alpina TaxID=64518 RepID=A0A9P6IUC7_MORAP|nr:hypothetical protein BGZ70_002303 [Mortierella alpina]